MKSVVQANPGNNPIILSCRAVVCGLLLVCAAAHSQTLTFYTLAGFPGQQSATGSGTNALFEAPAGSAVDGSGNIYVSDYADNTIEKISGGVASILAGSPGEAGSLNANGTNALFNGPAGLAVDAGGNVYVADSGNNTIRKITSGGTVSTLAGYAAWPGSANGSGTNAMFFEPMGLAVDSATNVYVADYGNHTIRQITPGGVVSTLAGYAGAFGSFNGTGTNALFYEPEGVAVDSLGTVYVADTGNDMIRKITAGVVSTLAGSTNAGSANATGTNASFNAPEGVAVDNSGNVYVADTGNNMIRKVTSLGVTTTLAGSANFGSADGAGTSAQFWGPTGIAPDSMTNLYVADYFNGTVRKVTLGGVVTTIAGSASEGSGNASGERARFNLPESVAADTSGNLYVADTDNHTIREISSAGVVSTLAGMAGVPGSGNGTGTNAEFNGPQAVAVDGSGNVYVADTGNNTIRKIVGGVVGTLAGTAGTSGNVDGTTGSALFYSPQGIAVDGSGNVYVADTLNYTIRKISGGTVSTLAGTPNTYGSADGTSGNALFNWPKGLATDGAGNIYVADCMNHTIRMVTPSGTVSTLAGTAGLWGNVDSTNSAARFFEPTAVVVDSSTNIYVADSGNQTIRKVSLSGANWMVTTIGGTPGTSGFTDGSSALFFYPAGIAISGGYLMVADSGNNTIRTTEPQVSSPPMLSIATNGPNSLVVSWPSPSTGYVLQQNSNLNNINGWTSFSGTINDNGTIKSVIISPPTGDLYFRLKH